MQRALKAVSCTCRLKGSTTASAGEKCARKNDLKFIVFYDVTIAQPEAAVAEFGETYGEYGPYSPMDAGQCTPDSDDGTNRVFSQACHFLDGTNNSRRIGHYVGGEPPRIPGGKERKAPYPNAMWFSFPNTCPLEKWNAATKNDTCRASTLSGLCPFGTAPDGTICTFSYKVMGWVPFDDLVGITTTTWKSGATKAYANFTDFCKDGNVEFETNADDSLKSCIDIWEDPTNEEANAKRTKKLVDLYNAVAVAKKAGTLVQLNDAEAANFVPLPTVDELTAANPSCYKSVATCAKAPNGCKRDTYSQTCTVCTTAATDCEVAPSGYQFPVPKRADAPCNRSWWDSRHRVCGRNH